MSKIENIEKKIEILQREHVDALAEIMQEIERLKTKQQPDEWPQAGDEYWCVGVGGTASYIFDGDSIDNNAREMGNMFRTEEEAKAYRAFRMSPRTVMRDRIQMWVDEYNGGFLDPALVVVSAGGVRRELMVFTPFAMKDEQGDELLLEKFGLDNILWACGGPEPEATK